MNDRMQNATVDSVRNELRDAMFGMLFGVSHQTVVGDDPGAKSLVQQVCRFAQFGANAGLIAIEEANDWLDVAWKRNDKTVMDVLQKWDPKNHAKT